MRILVDHLTVAVALGLLGPAALDEHGTFDEGLPDEADLRADLAEALADELGPTASVDVDTHMVRLDDIEV